MKEEQNKTVQGVPVQEQFDIKVMLEHEESLIVNTILGYARNYKLTIQNLDNILTKVKKYLIENATL